MRNRRHAALLALLLGAGCGSIEVVQTQYATAEEAKADGAIARGWLPVWLPEDAKNIIEIHDVDTNESTFSFSTGQSDQILRDAVCNPIESKKGPRLLNAAIREQLSAPGKRYGCEAYMLWRTEYSLVFWRR